MNVLDGVRPLSERITLVQHRLGLSDSELAGRLGVCRRSVWLWRNNKAQPHRVSERALRSLEREAGLREMTV